MTEHEELYEDDLLEDEELFEDGPEDYEAARVQEVNEAIAQFEREAGVDLSPEEWNEMGIRVRVGVSPEDAYGSTDSGRFEASFETTVEAVEKEQCRKLLDSEVDRMWEAAVQASEDPSVETDAQVWAEAKKATSDLLSTSEGVASYIGERLAVEPERTEASAVTEDDQPSFNVDDSDERAAAIDAAMSGQTVSTHGDDELAEDA